MAEPVTAASCIHDLNPKWCAICLRLKTPEEEQEELDQGMIKLAERLNGLAAQTLYREQIGSPEPSSTGDVPLAERLNGNP